MHEADSKNIELISLSTIHIHNIVNICFAHNSQQTALLVVDRRSDLANILTHAYQNVLPDAQLIDFDTASPDTILAAFDALKPGDLVVLIQSTNFRLEAYRLRVELFKKQLKVIEHPHLNRMSSDQIPYYVDALA